MSVITVDFKYEVGEMVESVLNGRKMQIIERIAFESSAGIMKIYKIRSDEYSQTFHNYPMVQEIEIRSVLPKRITTSEEIADE